MIVCSDVTIATVLQSREYKFNYLFNAFSNNLLNPTMCFAEVITL